MSAVAWGTDPDDAGRLVSLPAPPELRAVPELDTGDPPPLGGADDAPQRGRSSASTDAALPDPERWAATLVAACVEALAGSRPAQQLVRWLSVELYATVSRRAGLALRVQGRPRRPRHARVRSVRTCDVRPGVVEAAVVVDDGSRVRAVALRLEAYRGRWRATALDIL